MDNQNPRSPVLGFLPAALPGTAGQGSDKGELVAEHIRRLIFTGHLQSGTRLRQERLGANLGVTQASVREAFIRLAREDWLRIEPQHGVFVQPVDRAGLEDHYRVFSCFYGLVARRATERASDDELLKLQAAQRLLIQASNADALLAANSAYLVQLLTMAASPRLASVLRELPSFVPGNFFAEVPGAMVNQKTGVTSVTKAVVAREGTQAESQCHAFMTRQGDAVISLLSSRHLISA